MTKGSDNPFPSMLLAEQGSAPTTPASGKWRLFTKSDGLYIVDDAGAVTGPFIATAGAGGDTTYSVCQGRLTLTTAVPVTTADVTAATTLYFTPYKGDLIGTYNGSAWSVNAFTEKSLNISAFTADKNYDIFIVDGTLALEGLVWTNDTTRATALVLQNGILVKSGATTRRYLGTIRITAVTGQCEDSKANRYVWNYYNRVPKHLYVIDTTDTWTWGTTAWHSANANDANRVNFVIGDIEALVEAEVYGIMQNASGVAGGMGIGLDVTNANSAIVTSEGTAGATVVTQITAKYSGFPGVGKHFLQWIEYRRASTVTFYGDGGVADQQSGLIAKLQC